MILFKEYHSCCVVSLPNQTFNVNRQRIKSMNLFDTNSAEYAAAFQSMLRSTDERIQIKRMLSQLLCNFSSESIAVDWGAGSGTLTTELLHSFSTVYAVEPNPVFQNILCESCPDAIVIPSGISEAILPVLVDIGIMSHVLYYFPEETWGQVCLEAANHLTSRGILIVILKSCLAGENQMFEAFGSSKCDLSGIVKQLRNHPEFDLRFCSVPARFKINTFEETLSIARFMLNDRPLTSYANIPTEEEFQIYVRKHFWDETEQQGGWNCPQQFAVINRNPFYN